MSNLSKIEFNLRSFLEASVSSIAFEKKYSKAYRRINLINLNYLLKPSISSLWF